MPTRRFLCQNPAEEGHPFPEWQGLAYTAWAYSHQREELIDVVWVRCEHVMPFGFDGNGELVECWITNWILTEADTLEFRRLARLAKEFRAMVESGRD